MLQEAALRAVAKTLFFSTLFLLLISCSRTSYGAMEIRGHGQVAYVRVGSNVDLKWSSESNTVNCELNDGVSDSPVPATGSMRLTNLQKSPNSASPVAGSLKRFTLVCQDQGKEVSRNSVDINVLDPVVTISANQSRSQYLKSDAQPVVIRWNAKDVKSCRVTPFKESSLAGQRTIASQSANGVYAITCQTELGDTSDYVEVKAKAP